jgi:methyl-accepting chemotaxis protein
VIEESAKQFESRIEDVAKSRDEKVRAMMPEVRAAYAAYQKDLESTLRLVDGVKDFQMTQTSEKLRDAAMASRGAAETLQGKIRAIADELNGHLEQLARDSASEYEAASRLMIIFSVDAVVIGFQFGFLIGQYGVSKPIRMIVSLLQSLAEGRFDVAIGGTERGDEVGDVAKTALVFKENGLAKIRMEAEQKEAEQRAIVQRKQYMIRLADQF